MRKAQSTPSPRVLVASTLLVPMEGTGASRAELIEEVWPDKVLFAATILLITSVLGLLHGVAFTALNITLSEEVPWLLRAWPPEAVLLLSLVEGIGAGLSLRRQQTEWALAAGVAGAVSFSMFGLGSILALVSLVFVGLARLEGEDAPSPGAAVDAETWPDKALAASTVLVVGGVLTVGWGLANAYEALTFAGYMDQVAFGWLGVGIGLFALVAAWLLYRQQGALIGGLASLGMVAALGLYAVGPILGLAALYLIWQAHREDEFSTEHGSKAQPGAG